MIKAFAVQIDNPAFPGLQESAMTTMDQFMHMKPVNPGMTTLPRLMKKYNISSNGELANRAEMSLMAVEEISNGRMKIDESAANHLSLVFGRQSANLMLKMQRIADFFERYGRRPNAEERRGMLMFP